MPRTKKSQKKWNGIIYLFLLGALGTYLMPVIQVQLPAIGRRSWSPHSVIGALPRAAFSSSEKQKGSSLKVDVDFLDLLKKIKPADGGSADRAGGGFPISPAWVLGLMVPVALALSYLLMAIALIAALLGKAGGVGAASGLGVLSSAYALWGTFYLGKEAQRSVQDSVARASEGIFGGITKHFVDKIAIEPAFGLYVLFVLAALVFLIHAYRRKA